MSALAILGAHPGAGARTLACLLRGAGAEAEVLDVGDRLPADATPVLVSRSTSAGMAAAAELLASWHPDVPRPWLVVMADVPAPVPPAVRYRLRALREHTRGAVKVPYLWPLRYADCPDDVVGARAVNHAATRLHDALMEVSR
ncbi:MAG: hypothetical protein ACT4PP_13295 [Sporichthyaceae bacterium]